MTLIKIVVAATAMPTNFLCWRCYDFTLLYSTAAIKFYYTSKLQWSGKIRPGFCAWPGTLDVIKVNLTYTLYILPARLDRIHD